MKSDHGRAPRWSVPAEAWERIFGNKLDWEDGDPYPGSFRKGEIVSDALFAAACQTHSHYNLGCNSDAAFFKLNRKAD